MSRIPMPFSKPLTVAALVIALSGGAAWAQSDGDAPQQDTLAMLVENVTGTATGLQGTIDSLSELIAQSADRSRGEAALDEMLEAARRVNESLNADSEIWIELNGLLDAWTENRNQATDRMSDNPAMAQVAEMWQTRIDNAMVLRTEILDQATMSRNLVSRLEANREVVLAFYDLDAADQVIARMTEMSDQLGAMNTQMQQIADRTGSVLGPQVAQD